MKKLITFLILCVLTFNIRLGQNDRYFDEIFDSVNVTKNIKYADNFSVILASNAVPFVPTGGHPLAPDLVFDFY
jgi:hypothetical protein